MKMLPRILALLAILAFAVGRDQPVLGGAQKVSAGQSASARESVASETLDTERYFEDFEDGHPDYWQLPPAFEVRGTPGNRRLHAGRASFAQFRFGEYWRNYVFSARVRLLSENSSVHLRYRVNDASLHHGGGSVIEEADGAQWYEVVLSTDRLSLERIRERSIKVVTSTRATHRERRWYSVKIRGQGRVTEVFVDGVRRVRFRDPHPVTWGTIGLATSGRAGAEFDDLKVVATLPPSHTWTHTTGPAGLKQVTTIVADPSHPGVAFAGTSHNGVLKTIDGGSSWQQFTDRHDLGQTKSLDIDIARSDTDVVYSTHAEGRSASKSTDGGAHWTELDVSGRYSGDWGRMNAVVVDPTDPGTVYLGAGTNVESAETGYGVYRSRDGGETWKKLSIGVIPVYDLAIPAQSANVVYAASERGVFKSVDAGSSWNLVSSGITVPGFPEVAVSGLILDPSDPDVVYARAYVDTGPLFGPLFKTSDGGNTWQQIHEGVSAMAISSSDPNYLYVSKGQNVFQSDDGGQSWVQTASSVPAGGLIQSLAVDSFDPLKIYIGGMEGIATSEDGGVTTAAAPLSNFVGGYTTAIATSAFDTGTVYAGHGDGRISVTTDGGDNWQRVTTIGSENERDQVTALVTHPLHQDLLFAANLEGVFRSVDGGETFTPVSSGLSGPGIVSLAIDPTNEQRLFAGSGSHRPYFLYEGTGLFRSLDGGASWTKSSGIPEAPVPAIVIHPSDPNLVYAAVMGHGVYKSSDGGDTWQASTTGIKNRYVYSLAVDPADNQTVYAGTLEYYGNPQNTGAGPSDGAGLYKSVDGGATWGLILRMNMVETIAVNPSHPDQLFVGGHAESIWYSSKAGKSWQLANQGTVRRGAHLYMFAMAMSADGTVLYMANCGRGMFRNQLNTTEGYVTDLPSHDATTHLH
jgi:photosystem II stability/assembly factor-like uncharacterized protein